MKRKTGVFEKVGKAILTLAGIMVSSALYAQNAEESTIRNEFQLTGDVVSFPLTIVNSYPFISGEVNGVKGKFMFDTGHKEAISINNNIVPLTAQKEIGGGSTGSGQKFRRYTNDIIEEVHLVNGLH